jgi:trehalose/maltose hydrolase-like predicted phosphorylase
MGLRAEGPEAHLRPGNPLRPPRETVEFTGDGRGDTVGAITGAGVEIAMAARDKTEEWQGRRMVERLATWMAGSNGRTELEDAHHLLGAVEHLGFDRLLAEHRASWAQRWSDAHVAIDGDPESELAARFAVFHLLNSACDSGETAVGARGLTGSGYAGHVFWDADVFVLPALAAIRPAAARAMLEYRIRRLPAAQALARAGGFDGARFPWESAGDGSDVTPRFVRGKGGELATIATGLHEEHIVADVAWAASHYAAWTGDSAFLAGPGGQLIMETARYWASRIQIDPDGNGHLYGVMGPDEYHKIVDDNAYTNVMARWNLRRGAGLVLRAGDGDTATNWAALADRLVDGWDPQRRLYEQFAGYFELDPLLISEVAPPPVAADQLLGAETVAGSQLIKQADSLMLHHLVPDQVVAGSLEPCVAFYDPRTAHGSSLSPAIHASLLARVGEPERALELFRLASRLDLDDLTGTTEEGVHLATMGGVWQALAFGFLGVGGQEGRLLVRPCLPEAWRALALTFRFAGKRVSIRAEHDRVTITSDPPLLVGVGDHTPLRCGPEGITVPL